MHRLRRVYSQKTIIKFTLKILHISNIIKGRIRLYLEKITINGIDTVYAISNFRKDFYKAVNEIWKNNPPWERFQKKLIGDLAILSVEKERAIDLQQFEKLSGEKNLYSIRHSETKKNVRVIYTIIENNIFLITAFLEKNDGDYLRAIRLARKRMDWLIG